jgi:hypothetical protein
MEVFEMEKPVVIEGFEALLKKYGRVLSLKELVEFSRQIAECGYSFHVRKDQNAVKPEYEKPGLFDCFRRYATKERELYLTPAQEYMYRI